MKDKNKRKTMDFNEKLLNLEQNGSKEIEEVKESIEKQKTDIKLDEYVARNKWQVYKDLVFIFKNRSSNDNDLKKKYSKILIQILINQLIVMNIIFTLKGLNILNFGDATFNIFITATIAEVFTLVTTIVKYLFTDKLTDLISRLLAENNKDSTNESDSNEDG